MIFSINTFNNLTLLNLYSIYKLRNEVFIVEQNCAYQDVDTFDLTAHHLLVINDDELIAYARILPPYSNYSQPSIGRVIVKSNYRSQNLGKQLMLYAIEQAQLLFPQQQLIISAQSYLLKFYTNLGFKASGNEYLEDNIPHTKMFYNN